MRTTLKSLISKPYDFEPKTLGEHLLKRRLFLELSQAEVGKLFNVCSFTVGNWEKGHSEPKIFQIPILIEFLGYDPINHHSNSIAELLLVKRKKLGWTQKVAAKNLDVDPCTWSSWECGGTIKTYKHRQLVAEFLDISEEIVGEVMMRQWGERRGKN